MLQRDNRPASSHRRQHPCHLLTTAGGSLRLQRNTADWPATPNELGGACSTEGPEYRDHPSPAKELSPLLEGESLRDALMIKVNTVKQVKELASPLYKQTP